METKRFIYYKEDDMFIGWLKNTPTTGPRENPLTNFRRI
jgi:hypothetical protein